MHSGRTEKKDKGLFTKRLAKSLAVFAVVGLTLLLCLIVAAYSSAQHTKLRYSYFAADAANSALSSINYALDRAFIVESLVESWDGSTDFFEESAPAIYENIVEETGISLKNIALAPNGVVEKVYPIEGNEGLFGFDFMDADEPGNREAIEAYTSGEIVVTEPFELTQGGMGMGCRVPIFLEQDGQREFWGIVTLTIDYESLLQNMSFETLDGAGTNYELWYEGEDGERSVIAASEDEPQDPVTYDFAIRNLTWHLSVAPQTGWIFPEWIALGLLIVVSVSTLLALLVYQRELLHERNEELHRFAMLDGLTNCYRRQYITRELLRPGTTEWSDPLTRYSLLMVDLDHFKDVNDTFGHTAGDEALIATTNALNKNVRTEAGDCVIRYGGDEFVVLYNDVTRERFARKVRSIAQDIRDIHLENHPGLTLTCSIGGIFHDDAASYDFFPMLAVADKRLYVAKADGRDRSVIE